MKILINKKIYLTIKIRLQNKWKLVTKEQKLLLFFGFILFILFVRLFYLQVIKSDYYRQVLYSQHFTQSLLKAKRGDIYVSDKSGKSIKLTENIELYTMYVDPQFVNDKQRLISLISPVIYKHLCSSDSFTEISKYDCFRNVEKFLGESILKNENSFFFVSGDSNQLIVDYDKIDEENQKIINSYTENDFVGLINQELNKKIKSGTREQNYVGFFDNERMFDQLKELPYVSIVNNYIYLIPTKVGNINDAVKRLGDILRGNGYDYSDLEIRSLLTPKQIRYIKLVSNMSSQSAKLIKDLKQKYINDKIDSIPLLHGIGLEKYDRRFYPFGDFLSHVLGYVDSNGNSFYGIERYYEDLLKGIDGKLIGLSVPWIGAIGSNSIDMSQPIDGSDVYLTIDMVLQKEIEDMLKYYYYDLNPDSISVLVMDPFNGKIKATANYPNFNPNSYDQIYKIRPFSYSDRLIIDDDTYVDMPVLILSGDKLKMATYGERKGFEGKKFLFKNLVGPSVFVDKNIGYPYEPGSIFKAFTLGIGMDSDQISMYDFYVDKGTVTVGPYTISNVHKQCLGTNTFLHALEWSCNVGMVKIATKIGRYVYYNYLSKLGFGKSTGVELYGEDPGEVSALNGFSYARFFNNSFGQGILVTPIQIAVGYSSLVNGGYLVKPTIVERVFDKKSNEFIINDKKVIGRLFKQSTVDNIKDALFKVIDEGDLKDISLKGYSLGGKTGTSQIAFKGSYQGGNGWTNSSFVGILTKDDLRYVLIIQVRRPRKCQWGTCTAGRIYRDIANLLITSDGIKQ